MPIIHREMIQTLEAAMPAGSSFVEPLLAKSVQDTPVSALIIDRQAPPYVDHAALTIEISDQKGHKSAVRAAQIPYLSDYV